MFSLILKDLLLNKKYLVLMLLYGLLMIFALQTLPGGQYIAITIGIGYILMINASAYDAKNDFEIILNSLPISRRKIVFAKYWSVLFYTGFAYISYLFGIFIIHIFHISVHVSPISPLGILSAFLALSLMSGIYYPLYFKLGYLKSNLIKTMVFLLFFFAPGLVIAYFQKQQINPFLGNLVATMNSLSQAQLSLIVLFLSLLFLSLSLVLSLRFYQRREF